MPTGRERVLGCLLGGAIGDALDAPIEFDRLADIRARLGDAGVTGYLPAYGLVGAITDDTQMTLFTAEGLLRARAARARSGRADDVATIRRAYLRLAAHAGRLDADRTDGRRLARRPGRAPPPACARHHLPLGAVRRRPRHPGEAANDSKGCGGVMRVAPDRACHRAPLRHGGQGGRPHPRPPESGTCRPARSRTSSASCSRARPCPTRSLGAVELAQWPDARRDHALDRCRSRCRQRRGTSTRERIETLGGGWVGEEALAIGLCCALVAPDVRTGLELAVNHSGDSDSTGSIAGNLLGALHGVDALPADLLRQLEGRALIETVAGDLADVFVDRRPVDSTRYPPG